MSSSEANLNSPHHKSLLQKPVYAVVLCGGSGTRLWPLSRNSFPKQFLSLGGQERSLLQSSLDRLQSIAPPERRWLVLSSTHEALAKQQCQNLVARTIVEPQARNTAPAVALAAWELMKTNPDAIMVVLSSDHAIGNLHGFEESIGRAVSLAEKGQFVVLGIRPTFPSTGFGYIETGAPLGADAQEVAEASTSIGLKVASFKEKPDENTAIQFLLTGRYLWNAGMFIWQARAFWEAFSRIQPEMAKILEETTAENLATQYEKLPKLPIDIAFVEKASRVACVPALFEWNDIGSWSAVRECFPQDENGNTVSGDVLNIDNENSVIQSSGPFVAAVGLKDMVVVASKDAVLVMPAERSQDVKLVTAHLQQQGRKELL